VPLFQFAVFYNMDMEFGPGADMVISGPVHTNGNLIARNQTGFTNTLQFLDRVSAAGGFFADTAYKGPTYNDLGNADNGPGGTGPLRFQNPAGTVTDIRSGGGVWRDHKYGTSSVTTTTLNNFKTFATSSYGVNFRTSVHGVTPLVLPGVSNYKEADDPATDGDDRDNGRQIIEPADASDTAQMKETKFARRAGLYIIVNPDDEERTGILPDASTVQMRARSYRCWLNTVNADLTHSLREVVLPGQPSYGALNATLNALPNAYRTDTSVRHNQVLRIPQGGGVDLADTGYDLGSGPTISATSATFGDAYFWDLRRATNNRGGAPFDRSSYPYTPRPIAKIDFDMTRFKMTVERSVFGNTSASIYSPAAPNNATWSSSVLNPSASTATYGLGLGDSFDIFNGTNSIDRLSWSQSGTYAPLQITISSWAQGMSGAASAFNGYLKIEETTSSTPTSGSAYGAAPKYTTSAPESTYMYTPTAGVTGLRISLYQDSAFSTLLDQQIVLPTPDLAPLTVTFVPDASYPSDSACRFVIDETTDTTPTGSPTWTTRYTSATDETSHRYSLTSANVTGIRVRQYRPGGTSTLVRTQVVPTVIATLTNDYHTIPSTGNTASTGNFVYAKAYTEMKVYVGGVDDTDNWSFSVASSSNISSGGFGLNSSSLSSSSSYITKTGFNRYWVTGLSSSASTGSVTLRASKDGISIDRTFTLKSQTAAGAGNDRTGRWLNVSAPTAPDPFQIYFADSGSAVSPSDLITASSASPWFDGITVYIHSVDAEQRGRSDGHVVDDTHPPDRVDSGVRLWNGRGSVVSLPAATYPARTGFAFATNDAAYIVGHFNADGSINSNSGSTSNPGGYSARYPESSSEMLTSVMADAVTILSQPEFTRSGSSPNYSYAQTAGWSDTLSANRRDTSFSWSSSWMTTNPSSSNRVDGINASVKPGAMPNLATRAATIDAGPVTSASATTCKLPPSETEISAALLMGIVPTNHNATGLTDSAPIAAGNNQTSGGVHNFPRLAEFWQGTGLYIRGSMVAMFESRVAMEPWSIRVYTAASRYWGLHQSLRSVNHDLPLEPILLNARRMRFRELTATEYDAQKTVIEALPH
jgi:hypothetical protein